MKTPVTIPCDEGYGKLREYLLEKGVKKIFLVCGKSSEKLEIGRFFHGLEDEGILKVTRFSDFTPNPEISSSYAGIRLCKKEQCDMIAAIGGGSPMDVAKCVKLFYNADLEKDVTAGECTPCDLPFLAIPTTAGSGSEATRFAVVYRDRKKLSITDEQALPDAVLLDPETLAGLPEYQKKATLLDAFCHAVESYWSVNATEESRGYGKEAIELIVSHGMDYEAERPEARAYMMQAANLAGKAINIARTTAGHAMCYKLTTGYGLAHGHAASLCVDALWKWMAERTADDPEQAELKEILRQLSVIVTGSEEASPADGAAFFHRFVYEDLKMERPKLHSKEAADIEEELSSLSEYVNPERLKNHPITLDHETLCGLYRGIAECTGG